MRQQQYQIDVRSVEELFGQQEEALMGVRGPASTTGSSTRVSRSRSFKESSKDEVSSFHQFVLTLTPATLENVEQSKQLTKMIIEFRVLTL